jgi:hypothetical protein
MWQLLFIIMLMSYVSYVSSIIRIIRIILFVCYFFLFEFVILTLVVSQLADNVVSALFTLLEKIDVHLHESFSSILAPKPLYLNSHYFLSA